MYIGSLRASSNRATWVEEFQLYDDETNEPVDLTGATIVMQFRHPGDCSPILTADISQAALGTFQAKLTADQMKTLMPKQYDVGVTIERDGIITQEFIGTIPVLDGVVRS